nr:uncharacterized protein LOC107433719 isoform X2 [Ziziphus jujuba var. spinosa]
MIHHPCNVGYTSSVGRWAEAMQCGYLATLQLYRNFLCLLVSLVRKEVQISNAKHLSSNKTVLRSFLILYSGLFN